MTRTTGCVSTAGRAAHRERNSRRAAHAAGVCALLIACALASSGCERKVTLMQESGDSTEAGATSAASAIQLREAQEAWNDPDGGAHAAELTHGALAAELEGRQPDRWGARAEELLDSLGVGAEIAGEPCAMLVNLFSRSDPSSGSWPALYYCDGAHTRMQPIEGKNLKLLEARLIPSDTSSKSTRHLVGLFSRTTNGRPVPLIYVWARRPKATKWSIASTLGADSLGGYGAAELNVHDGVVDVVARTGKPNRGWEECPACPHVVRQHRFQWMSDGFRRLEGQDVPSSYATLVRFVDELAHDAPEAGSRVSDPALLDVARSFEWNHPKGTWRLAATEPASTELTVLRGQQESYRVTFVPEGDDWLIASITSVPRSLE